MDTNNKDGPWEYLCIDGNWTKRPIAFCKSKKGALTEKQIKIHKCDRKNCMHFDETMQF